MINGGGAGDNVNGGAGNDSINVGTSDDRVRLDAAFGTDGVTGFDHASTGAGQDQDKLDVGWLGITAATFSGRVTIAAAAGGVLVTITNGTAEEGRVTVTGSGVNTTTFRQADFVLAP